MIKGLKVNKYYLPTFKMHNLCVDCASFNPQSVIQILIIIKLIFIPGNEWD